MPNPAAPASSAPVTAGAVVTRGLSGADGKNSLNGIEAAADNGDTGRRAALEAEVTRRVALLRALLGGGR